MIDLVCYKGKTLAFSTLPFLLTLHVALQDHDSRVGYVRPSPSLVLVDASEHGGSEGGLSRRAQKEVPAVKNGEDFKFFGFNFVRTVRGNCARRTPVTGYWREQLS